MSKAKKVLLKFILEWEALSDKEKRELIKSLNQPEGGIESATVGGGGPGDDPTGGG